MNAPQAFAPAQPFALTAGEQTRFECSPSRPRWSMIAYDGGQPLEYNFLAGSLKAAIRKANDLAFASIRRRFVLRDPDGVIVRDQAYDAKMGVNMDATMRAIHGRKYRSPLPRSLPRTVSTPAVAFEARDGEGSHAHERSVTGMVK